MFGTPAHALDPIITMRSLLTAAEMSGTASISYVRSGCDVRVTGDRDALASDVADDGGVCDAEDVPTASANDSPRGSAMPVGGRSNAISPSPAPLDQPILGIRGVSERAGATLFMFVRYAKAYCRTRKVAMMQPLAH